MLYRTSPNREYSVREASQARDASGALSVERIIRLRSVMPEESPIDLDEHAALIAHAVDRYEPHQATIKQKKTQIQETRLYVQEARRFLAQLRHAIDTDPGARAGGGRSRPAS